MDKKLIEELKIKLETEKKELEHNLKSFATKDKNLKDDWDTKFPNWEGGTGGGALEKGADQVEQYGNMLGVEHSLETQLRDTNQALVKIEKRTYGKCKNCKGEIPEERLRVFPSAKLCMKCEGK